MSLPQLLPLPDAARELGVSVSELRAHVEAGTIAAGRLPDGEIVVSQENLETNGMRDINAKLRTIRREDFEHLRGNAITVTEAASTYGILRETIAVWVKKKYIGVLVEGSGTNGRKIDEADVAYCIAVHPARKEIGIRTGAPLLDDDNNPY